MKAILTPQHYYDQVAQGYDALYTDHISTLENKIVCDLFLETITDVPKKYILDLGCGTALGLDFLKQSSVEFIYYAGMDISSQMIYQAKKRFGENQQQEFFIEDMADLSLFKDNSFSVVTSFFGSFSHVLNYEQGLKEIQRVLKPGGKLFLMTYSRFSIKSLLKSTFGFNKHYVGFRRPYDIRNNGSGVACEALFYSPELMNDILPQFGFGDIRFKGLNYLMELPLIKISVGSNPTRVASWFNMEDRIFREHPQYAHSLITIATKQ